MNVLPLEKRERILALKIGIGASTREIAEIVECSREAVTTYLSEAGLRRKRLFAMIVKVFDELKANGIEPTEIESLLTLHGTVGWTCPFHPEAQPEVDVNPDGCRLCQSDGLKRHHARRKQEGRPILPPWRKNATVPPPVAAAPAATSEPPRSGPVLAIVPPLPPEPVRRIVRYPNRKLYDPELHRYVTLQELERAGPRQDILIGTPATRGENERLWCDGCAKDNGAGSPDLPWASALRAILAARAEERELARDSQARLQASLESESR